MSVSDLNTAASDVRDCEIQLANARSFGNPDRIRSAEQNLANAKARLASAQANLYSEQERETAAQAKKQHQQAMKQQEQLMRQQAQEAKLQRELEQRALELQQEALRKEEERRIEEEQRAAEEKVIAEMQQKVARLSDEQLSSLCGKKEEFKNTYTEAKAHFDKFSEASNFRFSTKELDEEKSELLCRMRSLKAMDDVVLRELHKCSYKSKGYYKALIGLAVISLFGIFKGISTFILIDVLLGWPFVLAFFLLRKSQKEYDEKYPDNKSKHESLSTQIEDLRNRLSEVQSKIDEVNEESQKVVKQKFEELENIMSLDEVHNLLLSMLEKLTLIEYAEEELEFRKMLT